MKYAKIILLFVGVVFLIGCAHFQSQPIFKYIPWQERQAKMKKNKNWIINGTLSITHNKKRDIASFTWQQNQNDYTINISGPLNLNSVKIIGTANQVEFCQSGQACIRESLNPFGWRLPISNMRYWVLAFPAPAKIEATKFDQYGHLTAFEQQGWRINYSDFQPVNNVDLPNIITLQNKKFFIKLKIKKYSFYN
ncbi:outer membrane lipoprotein LolB [Gammaproteobacteria bacterium]